jgi:hypothetical protein
MKRLRDLHRDSVSIFFLAVDFDTPRRCQQMSSSRARALLFNYLEILRNVHGGETSAGGVGSFSSMPGEEGELLSLLTSRSPKGGSDSGF